jgi:very-short-patch-repair endonuclease
MTNDIDRRAQDILRRQFRTHISELARARQDRYWTLAERCESPMERLLLAPLMFIAPRCLHPVYEGPGDRLSEAQLHVQHVVGGYRLDFAYIATPYKDQPIRLAIECDGHEFHASREQRELDAARMNALRGHGFETLRFTGSQIHADPEKCAQQVADTVDRIYARRIHDHVEVSNNNEGEDAA